jgi:hypothetical protein
MFLEGETPSLDVVQERHLEGFHVGPKPILQKRKLNFCLH